jgi:hypothetical protein
MILSKSNRLTSAQPAEVSANVGPFGCGLQPIRQARGLRTMFLPAKTT